MAWLRSNSLLKGILDLIKRAKSFVIGVKSTADIWPCKELGPCKEDLL